MKNTTKKYIPIILFLTVILVVSVVVALKKPQHMTTQREDESDYHTLVDNHKTYHYNTSIVSILLMGIDVNDENKQGQADAMQVLLLDRKNKTMQVIAIPRDTMADIKMFDVAGNDLGWQRQHLNLAYAYGSNPKSGCIYTTQAISRLFNNVPMNYYASLNLMNLKDLHNVVGTLDVVVPNNSLVSLHPEWTKGSKITITSKDVEDYVRSRDINKDFSNETRMERQRSYMSAFYIKLKEKLSKDFDNTLSQLYNVIKYSTTNITYENMIDFANMILEYDFNESKDYLVLEGENKRGEYHDEFVLDQKALLKIIKRLFYVEEE